MDETDVTRWPEDDDPEALAGEDAEDLNKGVADAKLV